MAEARERENICTLPNMLCVMRIVMSPCIGYLVLREDFRTAFIALVVAGVTDVLDGWIARTFQSQASNLGSFLDPLADKVLVTTVFVTLTFSGMLPLPLTILVVSRDVLLLLAGLYIRFKSLPPPRTLRKFLDPSLSKAQLSPTLISKANTVVQVTTVALTLAAPSLQDFPQELLPFLWALTTFTTVASAISYVFAKNTYTYNIAIEKKNKNVRKEQAKLKSKTEPKNKD